MEEEEEKEEKEKKEKKTFLAQGFDDVAFYLDHCTGTGSLCASPSPSPRLVWSGLVGLVWLVWFGWFGLGCGSFFDRIASHR
jgi:hypothetical protein